MKIVLFLNHSCNLSCRYCYGGRKFNRPLPLPLAQRAVDFGLERSPSSFRLGFFGGEPLMEMSLLKEVTSYAEEEAARRSVALDLSVVTNGTLLDAEKLAYLEEHGFQLTISMDGSQEAHEATRPFAGGRSSFGPVVRGLVMALEAFPSLTVLAVVDPANVRWLAESFTFLVNLGLTDIRFGINYEGAWDKGAQQRFTVAFDALLERYTRAWRDGLDLRLGPLEGKILARLHGGYSCESRCDFGCHEMSVAPSGRIYPCDRLVGEDNRDDLVIGTLETGLDEARRDRLIERKNAIRGRCATCDIRPYCNTWCGCVNYALTGDVGGISQTLCWFERTLLKGADGVISELVAQGNPSFARRFHRALSCQPASS